MISLTSIESGINSNLPRVRFRLICMLFFFSFLLSGKKRPAWDYKGRLGDMEELMMKSKSFMDGMTKTIGDNQDRIGFLESLNKQLEGTVQVKHQQTEEVS